MEKVRRVPVESVGRGGAGFILPGTRVKRRWDRPGITKMINAEEIIEAFYESGGEMLFQTNLLIKDAELREELGLPPLGVKAMTNEEMVKVLDMPMPKFKKTTKDMTKDGLMRLVDLAVEHDLDNVSKIRILQSLTGIDIFRQLEHKNESQSNKKAE